MNDTTKKTGSCECGAVAYEIDGPLSAVICCHCTQCRKTTGHHMAATGAAQGDFRLTREDGLKWYRSSDRAKRGFCEHCGSTLFWQADDRGYVAVAAGTLDGDIGLKVKGHIFCDDKGDYYDLHGGEFQMPGDYVRPEKPAED